MGLHCSHKALETRHGTPQEPIYWQFTGKTVTSRQLDETTTESRDVLSPAESTHRMKKLVCFGSLFKVTATPASLFIVLCLPWHKSCQKIDICLVSKSIQANMSPPAEWQPVSIKPWCPSTSLYPAYFKKQAEFLSLERSAAGTTPPNETALQSNGLLLQNGLFAVFSGTHTRKPLTFLSLFSPYRSSKWKNKRR